MVLARFAGVVVLVVSNAALASPICDRAWTTGSQEDKDACVAELRSKTPPSHIDPEFNASWRELMNLNICAIKRSVGAQSCDALQHSERK
jgi:hypothetical protein